MRGGVILLVLGIILAILATSGKYKCFTVFAKCATGAGDCQCNDASLQATTGGTGGSGNINYSYLSLPKLPSIPSLPSLVQNG